MSIFQELKRRNVFRIGIAYVLMGWVLLQAADFALDLVDAPNWVIQVFFIAVAIGLPIALFFAWAFEVTPEGIKREKDVDRSSSITGKTGRGLDRMIIAFLAIAVVYLLVDKLILQDGVEPSNTPQVAADAAPSVAVLPFINMSGDKDNEYFSDGLTETLLHMLAQLPDLRVAARTSAFAFKDRQSNITEIAAALGVAHILEGSVQKAGDRVRITAQLIRADDGFHVWSQNYTRPLEDIFAIQDEIAGDVADALGASLLGSGGQQLKGVKTSDLTAYDSYLKGLEEQAKFSYSSLPLAESHFKAALASDPGFTDARLALVKNNSLAFETGIINQQELRAANDPLLDQVEEQDPGNHLARALELAMQLAESGTTQGRPELELITDELRQLLVYIPTETFVRHYLARVLYGFFEETEEAIEVLNAGLLIDPLAADLHTALGDMYLEKDELEMTRAHYLKSVELEPDNPNIYAHLANLEEERNQAAASLEWMRRSTEVDPNDHELAASIARYLYLLNLSEEGDFWSARVKALAPGSGVARLMDLERAAAQGETESAIQIAASMISDRVDNRQGAFISAVSLYAALMADSGKSREAYDFLVSVQPEIRIYDTLLDDFEGVAMQWMSIGLMSGFESPQTRLEAWTKLTDALDTMGFPWRDPEDITDTWDLVIRGETEAAVEQIISGPLNKPLATNLRRRWQNFKPLLGVLYDDPRVIERFAELDRQWETMRKDVQDMLQQAEWNP